MIAMTFKSELDALEAQNRRRFLSLPFGTDLTSNDYLGMSAHPVLRKAAINALEKGMDIGAGGSRLLRGHTQEHADLEAFTAKLFKSESALYFANGFSANYALMTSLARRDDVILYDALIHASMRDGMKAAAAKSYKFSHNDVGALQEMLARYRKQAKTVWIAVESLYSMDGDCAPLAQIYDLAKKYDAIIIIDEAHATGIYGEHGRGLAYALAQSDNYERIITLHTCGKAIGVAGGLVCARSDIIAYLVNTARAFIYSTAPMPLQAYLVQKSLEILSSAEGDVRRKQLMALCATAHSLFGGSGTQIIPIILGDDSRALEVSAALKAKGYDIRAIRPPSVPPNTARLRLSLSCALTDGVLQDFANALKLCMEH